MVKKSEGVKGGVKYVGTRFLQTLYCRYIFTNTLPHTCTQVVYTFKIEVCDVTRNKWVVKICLFSSGEGFERESYIITLHRSLQNRESLFVLDLYRVTETINLNLEDLK